MGAAVRPAPEALRGGVPVTKGSGPAPLPFALASGQCGQKQYLKTDTEKEFRVKNNQFLTPVLQYGCVS